MRKYLALLIFMFLLMPARFYAQQNPLLLSLDKALEMASDNYYPIRIAEAEIELAKGKTGGLSMLPPTEAFFQKGELFSPRNDHNLEILQSFGSVPSYFVRKQIDSKKLEQHHIVLEMTQNELEMKVKQYWYRWLYLYEKQKQMDRHLFYFREKQRIAELQYKAGETELIELLNIRTTTAKAETDLSKIKSGIEMIANNLRQLISWDNDILLPDINLEMYLIDFSSTEKNFSGDNMHTEYYRLLSEIAGLNKSLARTRLFPEISAGVFNRSIEGLNGFTGWQISLGIPLWSLPFRNEIRQSRILEDISHYEMESKRDEMKIIINNIIYKLDQLYEEIVYYNQHALENALNIEETVLLQYEREDIEFDQVFKSMKNVYKIRRGYLTALNEYNQLAIQLEYYVK